jgi:hypothetical protein
MKLERLREWALGMPGAVEAPHFDFASFRVGGKIFATVPPEGTHAHLFVDDEHRRMAVGAFPEWAADLWWGKKIVGVRIKLSRANVSVVKELVENAWERKAPAKLVRERRGE